MRTAIIPAISLAMLCLAAAAMPLQAGARQVSFDKANDTSYALVRDGQRTTFVGSRNSDDMEVDSLKKQYPGNFIWYRQSGKTAIVRDPATLARVTAAWAGADKLGQDMQKLDAQMRVHSQAMTALSRDMSAATQGARAERSALEGIGKQMDTLGRTMDGLGRQMDALGKQIERESKLADASSRSLIEAALAHGAAQPVPHGAH